MSLESLWDMFRSGIRGRVKNPEDMLKLCFYSGVVLVIETTRAHAAERQKAGDDPVEIGRAFFKEEHDYIMEGYKFFLESLSGAHSFSTALTKDKEKLN